MTECRVCMRIYAQHQRYKKQFNHSSVIFRLDRKIHKKGMDILPSKGNRWIARSMPGNDVIRQTSLAALTLRKQLITRNQVFFSLSNDMLFLTKNSCHADEYFSRYRGAVLLRSGVYTNT